MTELEARGIAEKYLRKWSNKVGNMVREDANRFHFECIGDSPEEAPGVTVIKETGDCYPWPT